MTTHAIIASSVCDWPKWPQSLILDFPTVHKARSVYQRTETFYAVDSRRQFKLHEMMKATLLEIVVLGLLVAQSLGHRVHQTTTTTERASSRLADDDAYYDDDHVETNLGVANRTAITESPTDAVPVSEDTTYTIFGYECTIQR